MTIVYIFQSSIRLLTTKQNVVITEVVNNQRLKYDVNGENGGLDEEIYLVQVLLFTVEKFAMSFSFIM